MKIKIGTCKNKLCRTRQNKKTGGWFSTIEKPLTFLIVDFLAWRVKGYCSEKCMNVGERFLTEKVSKVTEIEEENKKVQEIAQVLNESLAKFERDPLIVYAMFEVMKEMFVDKSDKELRHQHQFIEEVFMESMSGSFDSTGLIRNK